MASGQSNLGGGNPYHNRAPVPNQTNHPYGYPANLVRARVAKSDHNVDDTEVLETNDWEAIYDFFQGNNYLHQGEMPANVVDRFRNEVEGLMYHNPTFTMGK